MPVIWSLGFSMPWHAHASRSSAPSSVIDIAGIQVDNFRFREKGHAALVYQDQLGRFSSRDYGFAV
eukprot:6181628-Pleurochrysis_carterae.AAC.2